MTRSSTRLLCWSALPIAALALSACETTDAGSTTEDTAEIVAPMPPPAPPMSPPPPPPPPPPPAAAGEPEVTYSTSIERIPQLDGSILVVTTTSGSDGSVWIDEEVIRPMDRQDTIASRDIGSPTPGSPGPNRGPASVDDGETVFADDTSDLSGLIEEEITPPARMELGTECDPDALPFDFTWPPPEPSARIEIPRALVVGGIERGQQSVERIQDRVEGALTRAGYLDQAFYTIGCDGFAIITRMEQIGPDGTPVEDGLRFTTPSDAEPWSLTGYLTRLFYAPPGFYRQIILAGTDENYDEDNLAAAPDEAGLAEIFASGSAQPLDIDADEMWTEAHKLHALIYEFETQGTRNVKQRRPSPIPAERHVTASGIYEDLE